MTCAEAVDVQHDTQGALEADAEDTAAATLSRAGLGLAAAEALLLQAKTVVRARLARMGDAAGAMDACQMELHGFAWMATYVEALRQTLHWAWSLQAEARFGELEELILRVAYGEYLSQLAGGLAMSQVEMVRPRSIGVAETNVRAFEAAVAPLTATWGTTADRLQLARLVVERVSSRDFGDAGLDETLGLVRDEFRRFCTEEVDPHAHGWHLRDELIPLDVVTHMAQMGVFGLTIPEEYGGSGLTKLAMAVVSEELSRSYIGVGSLGTRSEIAAELIRLGGTEAQKRHYLPLIASGDILPTAVFTEPDTGSDLGSLSTRAVKAGDTYRITGSKTWITHASRSDLMTVLARTGPPGQGYRGLSMFLAEKPRGVDGDAFPAEGMSGSEIEVLGYRGMKEYVLSFEGFSTPGDALLGGVEGAGFKQLMATFESARVQTAARAVGVAQNALELALSYAMERRQFGRALCEFPRVAAKLAWMTVETMIARQLTYFAAREKDSDRRCDVQAGMAKLLAARVAWSNADNSLQVHGGNGYALEYPISRVICDARILNIFEGAAEIQAQVVARGLLGQPDPNPRT